MIHRFSKPYEPVKPSKTLMNPVVISELQIGSLDIASMPNVNGASHIDVQVNHGYYDEHSVTIKFIRYEEVENPDYAHQMKNYNEGYKNYKSAMDAWEKGEVTWKDYRTEQELIKKRKMLEDLKKELGET